MKTKDYLVSFTLEVFFQKEIFYSKEAVLNWTRQNSIFERLGAASLKDRKKKLYYAVFIASNTRRTCHANSAYDEKTLIQIMDRVIRIQHQEESLYGRKRRPE